MLDVFPVGRIQFVVLSDTILLGRAQDFHSGVHLVVAFLCETCMDLNVFVHPGLLRPGTCVGSGVIR